jgi:hypothetical protein
LAKSFWDYIISILFRVWPDRDRKKLVDYEWADRRQEERAGIFFDRKEEGKERRGKRDQSREEENRDGGKEGRHAEEIRQENIRMTGKPSG